MTAMPMMPDATGRAGPAGVEEGLPGGDQAPDHDQQVEGQDDAEDLAGSTTHAASRTGDCVQHEQQRDAQQDQRRDEEEDVSRRRPLNELTESGEHRRQAGRGEAAAVQVSGVRPDPAGVHAGDGPLAVLVAHRARWRPGPSLARNRTWRRRAIDQPASDRPAS